jgi:predicted nucleic acid-binding protein
LTTEYVLWETVNALSKPPDRSKAHLLIAHVRSSSDWEVVDARADLFEAGLELHRERQDKSWSLTDCTSFVIMERRAIRRALTSDHHFEQAGYDAVLQRDPP